MGHMPGFARVVCGALAMLRFPRHYAVPRPLLYHATSHSFEQGTLPIANLISKQVVPYRTRDGNGCSGVSTPHI
jgi:hypothetical protein